MTPQGFTLDEAAELVQQPGLVPLLRTLIQTDFGNTKPAKVEYP